MKHKKIKYQKRYSQNNEPDKFGRWARIAICGKRTVAWISYKNPTNKGKYEISYHFPVNKDAKKIYKSIKSAKKGIKRQFKLFLKDIKNIKYKKKYLAFSGERRIGTIKIVNVKYFKGFQSVCHFDTINEKHAHNTLKSAKKEIKKQFKQFLADIKK